VSSPNDLAWDTVIKVQLTAYHTLKRKTVALHVGSWSDDAQENLDRLRSSEKFLKKGESRS
jgi:hypothetical protein